MACGDDGGTTAKIDAPVLIDTPVSIDAPADAPPDSPVAYDFSCEGQALPTMAAATITLSGTAETVNSSLSIVPAAGVLVQAFAVATDLQDGADKTTPADGTFTMDAHTTLGQPDDVYLKATKSGNRPTYVYPPSPFVADQAGIPVLTLGTGTFALLVSQFFQDTQDPAKGAVGVAIVDCANNPVAGATLVVTQDSLAVGRQHDASALNPNGGGITIVLDVPAGATQITASFTEGAVVHNWRVHTVKSFAGATTTTIARP